MGHGNEDFEESLDEEPRSILLGIISQLRRDMDLHRVTLPTFVLEPRSMLERITDFMSHQELILDTSEKDDPIDRFIDVVRFYMSGWHLRPKGVKKPYNPILGEFFRCKYSPKEGVSAVCIAEQVSHHPPISAFYYACPKSNISISGDSRPKSRFLGNSAATYMTGATHVEFTNRPGEIYEVLNPNVYVRGILFGTMTMELGDKGYVKCPKLDLVFECDFKTKGFFAGSYNSISGTIRRISTKEKLFELSGKWSEIMHIKDLRKKASQRVFLDVTTSKTTPLTVVPESEQQANESRRLWSVVTKAIKEKDLDAATDDKTRIEDIQRAAAKERDASKGDPWTSHFFEHQSASEEGVWRFKHRGLADDLNKLESAIFDTVPYCEQKLKDAHK